MAEPGAAEAQIWVESILDGGAAEDACLRARGSLSYHQLRQGVRSWSRRLADAGIGSGSAVALQMPPSFTYVQVLLALWANGAQVMLFDHRFKAAETAELIHLCHPGFVVRAVEMGGPLAPFREELELSIEAREGGLPCAGPHRLVQFSSGSTGKPKVIGRTLASLDAELRRWSAMEGAIGRPDRVLLLSSHVHTFGLVAGILQAIRRGAVLAWPSAVQARAILAAAIEVGATAILGVPFHYELLASCREGRPLESLRIAISGGERLAPEIWRRFQERYGVRIGQAYGMTEVGVIASDLTGRFPLSAGTVCEGVEVRLRDGEVEVRLDASPYLREEGIQRFCEGWLRTFDRAEIDPQGGFLTITGRSDSLVAIGGLKVDLMEVEAAIRAHGAVEDAVVVKGDVIEAYVASPGGISSTELLGWCRERLADHKVPKRFRIVPRLPRTVTGKSLRNRELLLEALRAGLS